MFAIMKVIVSIMLVYTGSMNLSSFSSQAEISKRSKHLFMSNPIKCFSPIDQQDVRIPLS